MTDIHPLQAFLDYNVWYALGAVILFGMFFLFGYFQKIWQPKSQTSSVVNFSQKNFYDALQHFENMYMDAPEKIFYQNLKDLMVDFLEYYLSKPISKMTLQEMEQFDLSPAMKNLYREVYFQQYAKYSSSDS